MPVIATSFGNVELEQVGKGRDLVLLHSLLTDRSAYDWIRKPLSKRRRLTLINLPGYGQSAPGGASVEDYADRVAATLTALNLPKHTDVLGNGLGGFVSVGLAIRHGSLFDRLVVVDALANFPEPGKAPLRGLSKAVRQSGMTAALDPAIRRMFNPAYIEQHPQVVEERKQVLMRMDPETFSTLCLALTRVEFAPLLSVISNRALVMVGAEDQTTAPEYVRLLAAGIPGAHYVEISDSGHCPQIEQPEAFVEELERFLAAP